MNSFSMPRKGNAPLLVVLERNLQPKPKAMRKIATKLAIKREMACESSVTEALSKKYQAKHSFAILISSGYI